MLLLPGLAGASGGQMRFIAGDYGVDELVWAATERSLDGYRGAYCADCHVTNGPPENGDAAGLWSLSAQLTGLDRI